MTGRIRLAAAWRPRWRPRWWARWWARWWVRWTPALDWGVLCLGVVALAWTLAPWASRPLTWDEVDYVEAARQGARANLLDEGTWTPVNFVRYVLAKARGASGDEVATAQGYDDAHDLFRMRHMHPPAFVLPLVGALHLAPPEQASRWTQLFWIALLGAVFLLVARALAPERPWLRAAALAVVLADPLLRWSAIEMHAHIAFAVGFLVPILALATGAGPVALGVAFGVLFAVVTVGPVWSVLWLLLVLPNRRVRARLGGLGGGAWARGALAGVAATFVVWPGGFLHLGLIQEHAFRAYNVLFLRGEEWSSAPGAIRSVLAAQPGLAVLATIAVGVYWVAWRRPDTTAFVVSAAALAFAVVTIPFLIIPRYALGGVALGVVVIVALARPAVDPRAGAVAGAGAVAWSLLALVAAASWMGRGFVFPDPGDAPLRREEFAFVDARVAAGERVAVEGGHVYAFYGTQGDPERAALITPVLIDYGGARLIHRVGTEWEPLAIGREDLIVLQKRLREPPVFDSLAAVCRRVDRPVAVHFVCGAS